MKQEPNLGASLSETNQTECTYWKESKVGTKDCNVWKDKDREKELNKRLREKREMKLRQKEKLLYL